MTDATADIDRDARDRLAPLWRQAGRGDDVSYPQTTDAVLRMLTRCDYLADASFVASLVTEGAILPATINGRVAWGPADVLALVRALEHRRRWRWPSKIHWPKFTAVERLQAEAAAAGRECLDELAAWSVADLLLLMEESDQRYTRNLVRVALTTRLRHAAVA